MISSEKKSRAAQEAEFTNKSRSPTPEKPVKSASRNPISIEDMEVGNHNTKSPRDISEPPRSTERKKLRETNEEDKLR